MTSAAAGGSASGVPRDRLAQIAFAGRSNVGKSTLLNALARRWIARTSAAPGKTRLANVFRVDVAGGPGGPGRWSAYLVDLPGYGYARGGAGAAEELRAVAEAYLASAAGVTVLLLVDSRHPGLEADIQAHTWLRGVSGPPVVVATKVDKLSRAERTRNLRELERLFGTAALPVSAASGEGLDELWKLIARAGRNNAANVSSAGGSGTSATADAARADATSSTAAGRTGTAARRAGSWAPTTGTAPAPTSRRRKGRRSSSRR